MKTTIIFGVIFCIAVSVLARRPTPTLPQFPVVFSATFNETDLASWNRPGMSNVFVDLPNKRASINHVYNERQVTWTLIYKPEGGDPKAPASQGYTMFNLNPAYHENVPNNCMYMTGDPITLAPFPEHWRTNTDGHYNLHVNTWFDLPSDLVYSGEYFIAELGVMADRWDTVSQCNLQQSQFGPVPCTSVMFSQGANPVPLMDIRAFGARPNRYESDMYNVRVYHSFKTSVKESNFDIPKNWEVNCGNADNDFVIYPNYPIRVYNVGGPDATLSIKLSTPPIAGLGDVKVYLSPKPTWYYNCVDCVTLAGPLIFTRDNWNVSQPLPMAFIHNGCSEYSITSVGGGYSWRYNDRTVHVYACEGENYDGCIVKPKCGDYPY